MVITPQSFIKLVRFDVTKENQITFPDGVAQVDYFRNVLLGTIATDFTYIKQEEKIRIPYIIDEIENYNYLIVQNLPYNYKYYFYYITNMEYVNDNMTDVYIKLDVFQTFQFSFLYNRSFVEREHVNSDNVGEHTIPEGLETGEYVVNTYQAYEDDAHNIILLLSNKREDETLPIVESEISTINMNGVYYNGYVYIIRSLGTLQNLLLDFQSNVLSGGLESVQAIYLVPLEAINTDSIVLDSKGYEMYEGNIAPMIYTRHYTKPTTLDGYSPKNKKLLTYPYCFMVASNNNGSSNIYHYEKFKSATCDFSISMIPTIRLRYKISSI